ncbi:MAG: ATP-binding cassette domain-containing protein [Desulfobacterales bacterium]|nr:ATP-binding cassette domain-containing protein [Desulfobacterales bacterium]
MPEPIQCRNLTFARPQSPAVLTDITVTFHPGRIALIMGPTGAGKTSLLLLLAGIHRPSTGEIAAGEKNISRWRTPHLDRWRRRVGIAFQHPALLSGLSVLENVMLPLIPRAMGVSALRKQSLLALERLGITALAGESVDALSGGQRQRVALARALAADPSVVIADEPTAHQDDQGVVTVTAALASAASAGATVIVAAHDPRLRGPGFAADRYRLCNGHLEMAT